MTFTAHQNNNQAFTVKYNMYELRCFDITYHCRLSVLTTTGPVRGAQTKHTTRAGTVLYTAMAHASSSSYLQGHGGLHKAVTSFNS